MPQSNASWGIEIGSNAIKAVRLVRQGSQIQLDDYDVLPFKKILTTPDLPVDEAIRDNLTKFYTRHDTRRSTVIASVPGSAAFAKFAKLPPVDPKKIPDIVKFEAVQQIPFPIEQVEWDYQVFTQPDSPDVEVGIFAITKERVDQFLNNFHALGQSVDGLTLSALSVYNALAYDRELTPDSPGVILMDIGTLNTDVIIIEGGNIWLRTLPIGGNHFTEALVRAFKLGFSKAEKLKREASTSKYTRQIFQAMRPVFSDLIQEIQRTLGFYQTMNHHADITKLIGIGSSFRLPGMKKFLRQHLQIEVTRLEGFNRIAVEGKKAADFAEQSLCLATAYGLALQGLGQQRVHANILPPRIMKQRLWRAKQPWIAVATAMLLIASASAWVKLALDQNLYRASLADSQPQITQMTNQANRFVTQWRDIEGGSDPRSKIERLRRILDYRDVWPKLMHDLTLAARALDPQPPLLTSDYPTIKDIPRDQRRRLYIESISAQYRFAGHENSGTRTHHHQRYTIEEIWGNGRPGVGGAAGQPGNGAPGGGPGQSPEAGLQPPAFVVTIKGTTPYQDGPKLISQHFIQWLEQNHRRGDRPYRIVVTKKALRRIEKIRAAGLALNAGSGLRPGRQGVSPARGNQAKGRRAKSDPRGALTESSWTSKGFGEELDALLPHRPLHEEPRIGDWSFEIEWTLQLLRPEEARSAETPTAAATPVEGDALYTDVPAHDAPQGVIRFDDIGGGRL